MQEVTGNLWEYPADAIVITTNGTIKLNGECVMGRGCAMEAKYKFPELPKLLGQTIQNNGNHVFCMQRAPRLITFPVKHQWFEKADITLIERSGHELVSLINSIEAKERNYKKHCIVMPRPGCGNGKLQWHEVKAVLAPILDDRFHVITYKSRW